jgi:hypothetical protein
MCQTAGDRIEIRERERAALVDHGNRIRSATRSFGKNLVEAAIEHKPIVSTAEPGNDAGRLENCRVERDRSRVCHTPACR